MCMFIFFSMCLHAKRMYQGSRSSCVTCSYNMYMIYIYVWMYVCICIHMYVFVYVYLFICICIQSAYIKPHELPLHVRDLFIYMCIWYTYVYTYVYAYAYIYIHTFMCIYMCVCISIYMNLHAKRMHQAARTFASGTWRNYICDLTHSYLWHDSLMCVERNTSSYMKNHSFMCVEMLTQMCDMTHSRHTYVWVTRLHQAAHVPAPGGKRRVTKCELGHDSFIRGTWLIDTLDMTHPYTEHHSFICMILLIHTQDTGWRRLIAYLKLQVIFRRRATNSRALLRKMT